MIYLSIFCYIPSRYNTALLHISQTHPLVHTAHSKRRVLSVCRI